MQQLTTVTDWRSVLAAVAKDRVAEMAVAYPERRAVEIPYMDVFRHDPEIAEEILERPEETLDLAAAAINEMSLPVQINMEDAEVRFVLAVRDAYHSSADGGGVARADRLPKLRTPRPVPCR